ncbi:hypothetical protein LCGC14_1034900 [marine sediment metagenome]|uniref:Uncharacterized protein n=1 Tax=marine sediment metagenome TaxID=412755 RepID=A0A0F9NF39_9ZZZZ
MSGEAQEAVQLAVVPIDFQLSLDSSDEAPLICVPHGRNMQVKVRSVGFTVGDVGSGALTLAVEWRDALLTGAGLVTTMATYTVTNVTPTREFDCDDTSIANTADVLGTLIEDLKAGLPLPEYSVTNLTRSLTYNEGAADAALTADQVGQIINDIVDGRIVDVVQTEGTPTDRVFDADSTSEAELADIVSVLHRDLTPTTTLVTGENGVNQGITGYVSLWDGGLILNQGDLLNLEITNTAGTDKEGFSAIVEYQIQRNSGG